MPDVVKHAWTHRPRSQGGTDPIEFEATGGGETNITALATTGLVSKSVTGTDPIDFTAFFRTPGSGYTTDTGDSSDFNYIMLPEEGFYLADFSVFWSTDFGSSTFPYIEPTAVIAGTPTVLVGGGVPEQWDSTQGWIGGEQFTTAEMDHHQLVARFWFQYTFAQYDPSFGIGTQIRSSFSGTKTIAGKVAVTRLCDALEEVV